MTTRTPVRRTTRWKAVGAALVTVLAPLTAVALAPAAAQATPDPSGTPIPSSQYALVAADSESPAYPAPPSLDGTAAGALDGDPATQWTVAYTVQDGVGVAGPLPHWLVLDVGGSFTLTGLDYSVKAQSNGPVKDVDVYATDDAAVAQDPDGDWGAPAGHGTLHQPTSDTEVQTVLFDSPVTARYVKFEATSTINGSTNVSASELAVRATGDTTPTPVDPTQPSTPATPVAITNGKGLTVRVAKEFPQVISYAVGSATMGGQAAALDTFTINGTDHVATTTMTTSGAAATWVSTFADLPGVTITSTIMATKKGTVTFAVTSIAGAAADTVDQLSIPDHSLVSVDSSDPRASLARTKISTDSTTTADQFVAVTGTTPLDAQPVGTPYGFVTDGGLSAGIITNATDDSAQDSNTNWNTRLQSRVVDAGDGARRAQLSVGTWTYAPAGATDKRVRHYALPTATVVLAADANGDGTVTWQDGAIAYRNTMTKPLGADRVPERVVAHIPFNFASQATNPFLKTLDNVKRISMSTDDLGQWVLEKGYGSEGHDSAHPDYGGNYNTRAGGLADLNTLTSVGAGYNADFAVHVNATEAYPQARTFSQDMVQGQVNGWDWLNQSYHIDQRKDLGSGAILDRFAQLRKEAPGIKTVYIDAYYSSGWLSDGLAQQLRAMGFQVASEWAYKFEGSSIWSHWANDKNYGGATNKGINSTIVRFISNSDRDVWNTDPILGGSDIKEFEGWTGQDDWNTFSSNIWTANLPTKFLQHYDLTSWTPGTSAVLDDGTDQVRVDLVGGQRQITMGDAVVARGGTYLLPWGEAADGNGTSSPSDATKMYYYNPAGGAATFTVTDQFAATRNYVQYKLTDQGRVKVADVRAVGGRVTLNADKGQPYVLVPVGGKAPHADAAYGQGTGVVDPGFNSGSLRNWNATGGARITRTANGDNVLTLGSLASGVSQTVTKLTPGQRYSLSTNVEIKEGRRRATTLGVTGTGVDATRTFTTTPAENFVAADAKQETFSQRASVSFTAPKNGRVTIGVSAVAGSPAVTLDDVRVMADTTTPVPTASAQGVVATANFEGNQPGWGPFVKGDAGGVTDPRTSISELHAPYSQKAWKNTYAPYATGALAGKAVDDVIGGTHSLKAHEENSGLVYRTVPATVPFTAGHAYSVSFRYQTNLAGQWQWVTGADQVTGGTISTTVLAAEAMAPALETATYRRTFTAGCGDDWIGLRKTGGAAGADFVLDDLVVTDLGKTTGGASCATVTAPATADLSPGTTNRYVTTFTNTEKTDATNVGLTLGTLPAGWTAQVATEKGNLFATVKAGQTVNTTWIVTTPDSAAGTSTVIHPDVTYFNACATKSVATDSTLVVGTAEVVPAAAITATADSENLGGDPGEGPVGNVLDGDLSTIWHTDYTNSEAPYPHWVQLATDATYTISGIGYQGRQDGGNNGKVKDYTVSVSTDGTSWTQVAAGAFVDSPDVQQVTFAPVATRYVRLTATSSLNGQPFAAAAEIRAFGSPATPLTGVAPAPRPGDTACGR